ncbi:neprilysin-2-like [Sitodiplosis mosellana]|uniref:neprilysin-2-like n=1 Tax=Sitodiplosis mosellana TaxID=263140 RepID=UPI002444CB12|nr:neprilysin-2-like [Sitodiplosis mosellana]
MLSTLIGPVLSLPTTENHIESNDLCPTPDCLDATANILEYIDETVEPCEDFLKFACGNYPKILTLPADVHEVIQYNLQAKLHSLIMEEINANDSRPFKLAKTFYRACMNEEQIEDHFLEELGSITDKLGGWPIVIDYPALPIDCETLINGLEDAEMKEFAQLLVDIAVICGARIRSAAELEINETLEFEVELAKSPLFDGGIEDMVKSKEEALFHSLLMEKINPNELRSFNLAKKSYKLCMNTTTIEDHGLEQLSNITDTIGGWPVIRDLVKGFENDAIRLYYKFMVDVAVVCGADRSRAGAELLETLEFLIELAKMSASSNEDLSELPRHQKLETLQEIYPYIQWVDYINALITPPDSVDGNEVVFMLAPSFFEKLGKLLQSTPKRVVANYLVWRTTSISLNYLTRELIQLMNWSQIQKLNVGITSRWAECFKQTKEQ